MAPVTEIINNRKITFPKDPKAGGTWYAVNENGHVIVLLNGAAEKHEWRPPYRRSRGLIVLDLISMASSFSGWQKIALNGIEPFTIVLFEYNKLYQLRWDGISKETVDLDPKGNYIWSSTPLYPREVRERRARWFESFIEGKVVISENEMFRFHRYTETEDPQNGLVINRNGFLKTISITQTVIEPEKSVMRHFDFISNNETTVEIVL